MQTWLKGVVLGGAVGAAAAAAQSARTTNEPAGPGPMSASADGGGKLAIILKGAFGGALAGLLVALFLDKRSRRRAASAITAAGTIIVDVADEVRPRVEAAVERAIPVVESALDVVIERAREAAETARPIVEHAAEAARERLAA